MDGRTVFFLPFFVSALLILLIAVFSFRRRSVRGAWHLIFLCISAFLWSASEGFLYMGIDLRTAIWITRIQYLGITPLPPLSILFVLMVFGHESLITRARLRILSCSI